MRSLIDENGVEWRATTREEETPRHHGRWHLVFQRADQPELVLPIPEIQWQTRESAERTIRTMSETELRRRLVVARDRVSLGSDGTASVS